MNQQSKAVSVVDQLRNPSVIAAFKAVLPQTMNADRFLSMAIAAAKVQNLSKYVVAKDSIIAAVYNAAKFGLDLNEQMGHAYLVPFKGKVTLIPGYKGLLKLIRNSGEIADVKAWVVYQNDTWDYKIDEAGPHYNYVPSFMAGKEKGAPICGVSVAWFKEAGVKPSIEVMPWDEILAIKNAALARTPKSPWGNKDYEPEMAKKTVLRRHAKMLPMSVEAAQVIDNDERVERGEDQHAELPPELAAALDKRFEDAEDAQTAPADDPEKQACAEASARLNMVLLKLEEKGKMDKARVLIKQQCGEKELDDLNLDTINALIETLNGLVNAK